MATDPWAEFDAEPGVRVLCQSQEPYRPGVRNLLERGINLLGSVSRVVLERDHPERVRKELETATNCSMCGQILNHKFKAPCRLCGIVTCLDCQHKYCLT